MGADLDELRKFSKFDKIADTIKDVANKQIAWQKEQYNAWKEMYGPLEKNMAKYYTELTPEKAIELRQDRTKADFTMRQGKIREQMAAKGLSGSVAEEAMMATLGTMHQSQLSDVALKTENQVMGQKMQFLNMGVNQGMQKQGMVGQAYGQQLNALGNVMGQYGAQYQQAFGSRKKLEQQAIAGAFEVAGTIAGAAMSTPPGAPKK